MSQVTLADRAREHLASGFSCAESTLVTFLEAERQDTAMVRLATSLCAGVGGNRDLCGILTAAQLVIGLKRGRTAPSDICAKQRAFKLGGDFYKWFASRWGCRCDQIVAGEFRGPTEACRRILAETVQHLQSVLADGEAPQCHQTA